jgi:hypothetical protein
MPSIIMTESGERVALTDGDAVETSGDVSSSAIIVDAVMKSLTSSLAASGVMGSSDSRGKSRSPLEQLLIDRRGAYQLLLRHEDRVRVG